MEQKDADYFLEKARQLAQSKFNTTIDLNADKVFSDLFSVVAILLEELMDIAKASTTRRLEDLTGDVLVAEAAEVGIEKINGEKSTASFNFINSGSNKVTIKANTVIRVNSGENASYWKVLSDFLVQAGQTVKVTLYSREAGAFYITTSMTAAFMSPIAGMAVTVADSSIAGRAPLDDDSLREEIKKKGIVASFGNDYFVESVIRNMTGIPYVKLYTNPNYDSTLVGSHTLPGGNVMIIIYPNSISDEQLALVGSILLQYLTPGTTVYLPSTSDEGASTSIVDPYNKKLTYGVIFAEAATLDIQITIVSRGRKNTGILYSVEELKPPIKSSLSSMINNMMNDNPLGISITNQQFIAACINVPGCTKVTVTVSVNGGSYSSSDLTFDALEYPVLRNIYIT